MKFETNTPPKGIAKKAPKQGARGSARGIIWMELSRRAAVQRSPLPC